MNIFLLVVAIVTLLTVLKRITAIEKINAGSIKKEIKKHTFLMLWGIIFVSCILFIPYQIWVLTGSSNDWNGVYIIGASVIATIIMCFTFYSTFKIKKRFT
ncbi:hypothetical protein [Halalkalibacter alkalisediminis]|uniref:Uncharacterized protein n=1 Tax=Halalkalibacter alkalisediminis TaxID=935616 RepID=A0ABV6NJ86_9BACI|nr:hypothetical protein [Halalkalibacter alkalisediminis]